MTRAPKVHVFHDIVTVSPVMLELFELLKRVSRTHASVLIRGETGTGKELFARAVHALSPRSEGPFRAVNCATFTPELLASELFGHKKGAFTGAIKDHPGLFTQADSGTLFLDELAELPLELQARLLRVLQEKTFVPVGGTESLKADVRLVSATHRSLRAAVAAGLFRADLMYRVRVVPVYLPPLRERPGDIEALAWHFAAELSLRGERVVEQISREATEALLRHDWPGNVRELRNALEYAFAVGTGPVLTLADLPPELTGISEAPAPVEAVLTEGELERRRLVKALDEAKGKKGKAAELLEISRSTLWRKLREHRLI